ncbi:MAG: channel protein hemolysin family [Phycisphaerales bacterium]|jgi:hemolysin III|nr:channel protein hemolysin family [Phycisphaerales bacterium]
MPDFRRWIKDPFPGLSHFFGALLAVAGLVVLLVVAAGRPWQIVSFSIYGTTLILLYLASGLAHCVYCSPRVEKWLDRFDYIGIYLLIAGTYTPICLITLRGPWGWTILGVEWGMALIGITIVLTGLDYSKPLRTGIYVAMGWMALIAAIPTLHALPTTALLWLFGGGAAYSIGAIIFVTDRPHLWPGWFNAHDLWHCLVLTGSACHFIVMVFFVA